MPRKKRGPTPYGSGYWRSAFDSDVESHATHEFNNDERRIYSETYDEALRLKVEGKTSDEIHSILNRPPEKQIESAEDPPGVIKHKRIRNRYESLAAQLRRVAIDDALADKPKKHTLG